MIGILVFAGLLFAFNNVTFLNEMLEKVSVRQTYLFENRPQAQPDQDVGRNDGDGRFCRGTAHSWW